MSAPGYPPINPPKRTKAPLIGLVVILMLAVLGFIFLSSNAVLKVANAGAFTGDATVLDTKIKGQKCYLDIRRDDGIKELRAAGYRNECGKYDEGDTVHYTKGIIDD